MTDGAAAPAREGDRDAKGARGRVDRLAGSVELHRRQQEAVFHGLKRRPPPE